MFKDLFQKISGKDAPVPVLTEVLMTREAMDNSDITAVVQMNITILNHFLRTYRYLVPEVAPESVQSYSVDFYCAQVKNGGHEQFAHNAQGMPNTWKFARDGLLAMGATQHLALFDRFKAIVDVGDKRAKGIIQRGGFGDVDAEVEDIDKEFYAVDDSTPLRVLNAKWLRSLANLKTLAMGQLENHINSFGEHPAVKKRMAGR